LSEQTVEDSNVLNSLNLWQEGVYPKDFQQRLEEYPKTLFVYANNEPRKSKNMAKLKETSEKYKVPVARLNCHYESNKPNNPARLAERHHFKNENYQDLVEICLHSRVSLTDNFVAEIGLFNGARPQSSKYCLTMLKVQMTTNTDTCLNTLLLTSPC